MFSKKWFALASLVMVLGLLFTACQTPTPQVIVEKETVEVVVTPGR